jgi:hypothetical protein
LVLWNHAVPAGDLANVMIELSDNKLTAADGTR